MMILGPAAEVRADTMLSRDFETDSWADGLTDVRHSDRSNTSTVDTGYVGSGLEVNIPPGTFRGLGPFEVLSEQADEAWYRYHVMLTSFDSRSSGKLPGLSGLYSSTARGCKRSVPGSPGWSARGLFGAAGSQGAPGGHVPIGTYIYHLDQPGACGEADYWPDSSLQPGRWHCVEGHVKLNTPGARDGVVDGWLDGVHRYRREGLAFRRADEARVNIRQMWLDVYFGGRKPTPNALQLLIDEVEVSTRGRLGCVDSSTYLVGSFGGGSDAIATYVPEIGDWTLNSRGESAFEARGLARYRTAADWTTHLAGDFNGDGRDDLASYHPGNGSWWVSRTWRSEATTDKWADFGAREGWGLHLVGDFSGEGRDDIASFHPSNGTWWVSTARAPDFAEVVGSRYRGSEAWLRSVLDDVLTHSTYGDALLLEASGTSFREGFETSLWDAYSTRTGWTSQVAGDFDGDGRDDIASYHPGSGTWWVSRSTGGSFETSLWDAYSTRTGWTSQVAGDFDGDGRDDIASYHAPSGTWWVGTSDGTSFQTGDWTPLPWHPPLEL